MNLQKSIMANPNLSLRSLVFLIKEDQMLLGLKKKGFGKGKWMAIGGKPEQGETIEQTARREFTEEVGASLSTLEELAKLNFYFPDTVEFAGWNQKVVVYLSGDFEGEIKESEEMKPQWFNLNNLPIQQMWQDNRLWLDYIITGKKFEGWFLFDVGLEVVEWKIDL